MREPYKLKLSLLEWGISGFRSYRTIREDRTGELGIDIEVTMADGSSNTLRVTVFPDGEIGVAHPVSWAPPNKKT